MNLDIDGEKMGKMVIIDIIKINCVPYKHKENTTEYKK